MSSHSARTTAKLPRHVSVALLAAFGLVVPGSAALAQGIPSAFDRPDIADRAPEQWSTIDVQKALIWTGHYNGLVDGQQGPAMKAAIAAWLRSRGYTSGDSLSADQTRALVTQAAATRSEWQWQIYTDPSGRLQIGYPAKVFSPAAPDHQAVVNFGSNNGGFKLQVLLPRPGSPEMLEKAYQSNLATSSSTVFDLKARQPTWFVLGGTQDGFAFYRRTELVSSTEIASFTFAWPLAERERYGFLAVAIANSFRAGNEVPASAASGKPPSDIAATTAARTALPGGGTVACEDIARSQDWTRIRLDTVIFGRPFRQLTDADFQALAQKAADCTKILPVWDIENLAAQHAAGLARERQDADLQRQRDTKAANDQAARGLADLERQRLVDMQDAVISGVLAGRPLRSAATAAGDSVLYCGGFFESAPDALVRADVLPSAGQARSFSLAMGMIATEWLENRGEVLGRSAAIAELLPIYQAGKVAGQSASPTLAGSMYKACVRASDELDKQQKRKR